VCPEAANTAASGRTLPQRPGIFAVFRAVLSPAASISRNSAGCSELPKDGKPNLINYDLRDGTYIIPKVMDSGYVELGKKRMEFSRKG
jgi:hypothetical protein